jgi:hypothetical protein
LNFFFFHVDGHENGGIINKFMLDVVNISKRVNIGSGLRFVNEVNNINNMP